MAGRPGMQAAELYEEPAAVERPQAPAADALGAPAAAPGTRARVPARARRARRRWWVLGAAVAVAGVVGAQVAVDAHQRAQDARADAVPGAVARADSSLAPVWRMDDRERRFVASAARIGDTAVGVVTAQDGSRSVSALDVATGAALWSYPLNGPDAQRAEGGDDVVQPGSCVAVPEAATPRVACYVTDGVSVQTGGELVLQLRAGTAGRVVVLDASGARVVDRDAPLATSFTATDRLLVLGASAANQHREVDAQDLVTGAPRWTWQTPLATTYVVGLGQRLAFQPFPVGPDVGVALPGGQLVLLGPDGSVAHEPVDGVWSGFVSGSTVVLGVGEDATRLVRAGAPDVVLRGAPLRTTSDDGSLPGLVLTSEGGSLHAWDATTGRARWQASISPQSRAVVLRGHVAVLGSGALVVLDGHSGVTVAATPPAAGATLTPPLSDGRHVLVAQLGTPDERSTITGYGADGSRAWSAPLPAGTSALQQAGRQLLVYDDAGLEVLGTRE
jgi:hypothetical protein